MFVQIVMVLWQVVLGYSGWLDGCSMLVAR
jgi:hypothetical protein